MTAENRTKFETDHAACLQQLTVLGADFDQMGGLWLCRRLEAETDTEQFVKINAYVADAGTYGTTIKAQYRGAQLERADVDDICDAMHKKARIWLESNDVLQPPKAPEPTQGASTSTNNNAPQGAVDFTNIMTYLEQRETRLMQSLDDQEQRREQRQAQRDEDLAKRQAQRDEELARLRAQRDEDLAKRQAR